VFRSDFSVQAEPFHCSTKPLTVELELPPATRAAVEVPMLEDVFPLPVLISATSVQDEPFHCSTTFGYQMVDPPVANAAV
jgi:hypothetical protein